MVTRSLSWPSCLERIRSLARTMAVVTGGLLVAFHGWLFAVQVAEGRLEDPWLVLRWVAAAGLVGALAAIHRRGQSLWSRHGIAVWVLAALLHGPAVATDVSASVNALALPEAIATSVLQQLVSLSALAITLWMLAGLLARRDRHSRLYPGRVAIPSLAGLSGAGYSPQYSSRPPPRRI